MRNRALSNSSAAAPPTATASSSPAMARAPQTRKTDGPVFRWVGRDHDAFQVRQALQGEFRQVLAVGVTVERRVEVGAGVGDHLDLADLELGARSVVRAGLHPAEEVADERGRQ